MTECIGQINLVKFGNGNFGVRRTEKDGKFSFLDMHEAEGNNHYHEEPLIEWHKPDEKSYQPGGESFDMCQCEEEERARSAFKLALERGDDSEDFGEPIE